MNSAHSSDAHNPSMSAGSRNLMRNAGYVQSYKFKVPLLILSI